MKIKVLRTSALVFKPVEYLNVFVKTFFLIKTYKIAKVIMTTIAINKAKL